jgi:pimeloyl-ACP methyl ester carboxylesterase
MPSIVQSALRVLVDSTYAGQASEVMIVGFVRQVRRYFEDLELREKIQAELSAAVGDDTRVLVAHSLGSVVAYEALRNNPEWPVQTLITLGSPLGLPSIQQRLWAQAGLENGWAGPVRTWVNIAARQDAVAMVKELAPVFHPDIRDLACSNPYLQAHQATWYLKNAKFAEVLCDALG